MGGKTLLRQSTCNQCKHGRAEVSGYQRSLCVKTGKVGDAARACYCDMFEFRLEGSSSYLSPQGFKYRSKQIEDYRTRRQWEMVGRQPKKGAKGHEMHASMESSRTFIYYLPDEVEPIPEDVETCATCSLRQGRYCIIMGDYVKMSGRCSEWEK